MRTEMGSVHQFSRRRPVSTLFQPAAARRNYEEESWKSMVVLAVVFTGAAIAMSLAVVLTGSNSWAEAVPLIAFVVVFALTKVVLADALFYVMIRSDEHSEAAAAAASKAKAAGLVIRRPRITPGLSLVKASGARPRKTGASSNVRLAVIPRKPRNPPPRRTDH
jgi:hypothetical protein